MTAPQSPQRRRPSRAAIRTAHLVLGMPVGTVIYAPADFAEPLRLAVQVGIMPGLIGTGLWMWLAPKWRRRSRQRQTSPA